MTFPQFISLHLYIYGYAIEIIFKYDHWMNGLVNCITDDITVCINDIEKKQLFVAFPWVETSTGPGGFMICVFII